MFLKHDKNTVHAVFSVFLNCWKQLKLVALWPVLHLQIFTICQTMRTTYMYSTDQNKHVVLSTSQKAIVTWLLYVFPRFLQFTRLPRLVWASPVPILSLSCNVTLSEERIQNPSPAPEGRSSVACQRELATTLLGVSKKENWWPIFSHFFSWNFMEIITHLSHDFVKALWT